MNTHSLAQPSWRGVATWGVIVAAVASAHWAYAQPTGNPKGSAAPPSIDSQKAPAARAPASGFGDSGKIVTDESKVGGRTQTSRPAVNPHVSPATQDPGRGRANSGPDVKRPGSNAKPPPQ